MPFFEFSTGVIINDSNFYDIGRDMTVHSTRRAGQDSEGFPALEFGASRMPGRQLEGPERNGPDPEAARTLTYDNCPGPQIAGGSNNVYAPQTANRTDPWSMSVLNASPSNPLPHPLSQSPPPGSIPTSTVPFLLPSDSPQYSSSQLRPEFHFDPSGADRGYTSNARDPGAAIHDTQAMLSVDTWASHPPGHGNPLYPQNYLWPVPTASASESYSIPFQNPSPQLESFSHPDGSGPRNALDGHNFYPGAPNRAITYPSTDFEPYTDAPSGCDHLFPGDVRERELQSKAAFGRPHSPWNRPRDGPKTSIHGSTFVGGNVNHIQRQGEIGLHILHRVAACDAFHNSAERYPQPKCHPETRTKMLEYLWNWACGIEPPRKILPKRRGFVTTDKLASSLLWLHGPAGAGKSALAQSLCERLEAECCLTANFFFKRGHESRGNATRLFSTIAYQLAVILPQLNDTISQIVEKDPATVEKLFSMQLQKLIVEPCRQIIPGRTVIIIIDGLDECRGEDVQQEILRCIGNSIQNPHSPVRFLISSRPESHIRKMFKGPSLNALHCPVNIEQSFEDVRRYLLDEFARIHRQHRTTMAAIPTPWPSSEVVENLVKKSSGYFIYVSTVIKFIDDENFRPTDRLDIIM
ncbi:hypothetical protein C8R44DRAFT_720349, partial [Mycena epipterygia]